MKGALFEIQGRQKSGKTETIHLVWDRLREHPEAQVELVGRGRGRREIKGGILNVDGVLVGIMSKSEPARNLLDVLRWLVESGCQVIVCATHGPGTKSAKFVYGFCHHRGWLRIKIKKDQYSYDDEEVADRVVAEVLGAANRAQQVLSPA